LTSMLEYQDGVEAKRPPLPKFGKRMTPEEVERFKSFKEPSFTEWVHSFNNGGNGVDTNAEGELLNTVRMSDKTSHGKMWKAIGGEFTPEEMAVFEQGNVTESDPNLSVDEINSIINADQDGRSLLFKEQFNNLRNANIELDEATNAGDVFPMRNEGQSVGFGASTAIGLLSGLASQGIVSTGETIAGKKIDDTKDVRTGVVGGLSGYLATRGVASLAGQVAGGEEIAIGTAVGTTSAIAGKEAGKLAKKAGAGEFGQAEASGTAAGATAGFGSALGAGALLGAEAGVPLDAETLGMASVVGAGIGAGISGIGYSLSKLGINI